MILIVKEVRQMLIALSRMLVVGHKFGVPGKFKSIHGMYSTSQKQSHFSQRSGHFLASRLPAYRRYMCGHAVLYYCMAVSIN